MPARSGGSKLVVTNLRDQPVEIHHGEEVVVVPPRAEARLPVVRTGGEHLAELERQGLVSVQSVKSAPRAEEPKQGSRRRRTRTRAPKSSEGGS